MFRAWIAIGASLGAGLVGACSAAAAEPEQRPGRDLSLTPGQIERMDIKVHAVTATSERPAAILPGTVVPALNARIVAAAPFGGTVTQVQVLAGQRVEKGAVLATVSSRELIEAASAVAQAEAELQLAEANARRRRFLADKNIQNPTMAEEADAQVAKVKAVIAQHKRMLDLAGKASTAAGTYSIHAPAAGRIVETSVMPGDKIDAMGATVTIDTSDELWVEAQLPAHLVPRVAAGDRIRVNDGPEGKVISVGGSLDKMTRSAKLYASIPSDSGLLPGQMVSLSVVQQAATGALSVPASAIARINNIENVFVRNGTGFTLVPVEVAGRSPGAATIHGAIPHGAEVAASGIPQLEQMLGAE